MKMSGHIGIFILLWLGLFNLSYSQTSLNEQTGSWTDGADWIGGTAPPTTNITSSIVVDGYITRNGNLDFENGSSLTINTQDTLVVVGDLNFNSNSNGVTLSIASGAILLVTGNFSTNNNLDISSGGKLIVAGDFSPGNNVDYTGTSSNFYVFGTDSPSGGGGSYSTGDSGTESDFNNDESSSLINFVNGVLPIELLYFKAFSKSEVINFFWATTSETNFDYFTIQRSVDGSIFTDLASIEGNGDENVITKYTYTDFFPKSGISYYRLKATDMDGSAEYFETIKIITALQDALVVQNPIVTNKLVFSLNFEPLSEILHVSVLTLSGREIHQAMIKTGSSLYSLNLNLPIGYYLLKVKAGSKEYTRKIILQ